MEIYLILVMLVLPGAQPAKVELHREFITASSFSVCQTHADKRADEQKKLNEETIKKQEAKVFGRCYSQGTMT